MPYISPLFACKYMLPFMWVTHVTQLHMDGNSHNICILCHKYMCNVYETSCLYMTSVTRRYYLMWNDPNNTNWRLINSYMIYVTRWHFLPVRYLVFGVTQNAAILTLCPKPFSPHLCIEYWNICYRYDMLIMGVAGFCSLHSFIHICSPNLEKMQMKKYIILE